MTAVIDSFDGENRFLSNFYPSELWIYGMCYKTSEHAFQALKMQSFEDHEWVRNCETPGNAKRMARRLVMRADWMQIRDAVMLHCLRAKFTNSELALKLSATGDAVLVEGNHWGDTYWGVCKGVGENKLGQLLMQVRQEIKQRL